MKNTLRLYFNTITLLCLCICLFSLIFATLYYFNMIHTNVFHISNWICSIFSYGLAGFYLGYHQKKKALYSALCIVLCFSIPILILHHTTIYNYLDLLSKVMIFVILCMFAYSKKQTS